MTAAEAARPSERRTRLEACGVQIEEVTEPTFRAGLERLGGLNIESLLLEGGAALHGAAWDEGLVDFVRLYVAPLTIGPAGVPLLEGRSFSSADSDRASRRTARTGRPD